MSFRQPFARLKDRLKEREATTSVAKSIIILSSDDEEHELDEATQAKSNSASSPTTSTMPSSQKWPIPLDSAGIPSSQNLSKGQYVHTSSRSVKGVGTATRLVVQRRSAPERARGYSESSDTGSDYVGSEESDDESIDNPASCDLTDTNNQGLPVVESTKSINGTVISSVWKRRVFWSKRENSMATAENRADHSSASVTEAVALPRRLRKSIVVPSSASLTASGTVASTRSTSAAAAKLSKYGFSKKEYAAFTESLKKASKGSTPESELKLAAQAECVTFFKYFVDYGLSWPDYKKLDKWSRQSVGQKYIQRMAALRYAHPSISEEELHLLARQSTANYCSNALALKNELLERGQVLECTLCGATFTTKTGMYEHTRDVSHGWVAGGPCLECEGSAEAYSYYEMFRFHIHDYHVVKSDGTGRPAPHRKTRITASTDHRRCERCKSCIYSQAEHKGWCAAEKFDVSKVIAGSSSDDISGLSSDDQVCECNESGGRFNDDKWRNNVLLKAMNDNENALAESLLRSSCFVEFKNLVDELRQPNASSAAADRVYVMVELTAKVEETSFHSYVSNVIYVGCSGSAQGNCWTRALHHILNSLRSSKNSIKSTEHIRTKVKNGISSRGPRQVLVPLSIGGDNGQNFGRAAEAIEILLMVVLGVPNLLNTIALSIAKPHKYDERLVKMFAHAGEIVTAILYSTWQEVFHNNNALLPRVFDLTDGDCIDKFKPWDPTSKQLKAEVWQMRDNFVAMHSNVANAENSNSSSEGNQPSSSGQTTCEANVSLLTPGQSNPTLDVHAALKEVALTGKPLNELINVLREVYATVHADTAWKADSTAAVICKRDAELDMAESDESHEYGVQEDESSDNELEEFLRPSRRTESVAERFLRDQEALHRARNRAARYRPIFVEIPRSKKSNLYRYDMANSPSSTPTETEQSITCLAFNSVQASPNQNGRPNDYVVDILPETPPRGLRIFPSRTPPARNYQTRRMLKSPSGPASVFAVYADSNVALASAEHPKNKPSAYKKFRKEWDLIGYAPSLPDDASSSNSENEAPRPKRRCPALSTITTAAQDGPIPAKGDDSGVVFDFNETL